MCVFCPCALTEVGRQPLEVMEGYVEAESWGRRQLCSVRGSYTQVLLLADENIPEGSRTGPQALSTLVPRIPVGWLLSDWGLSHNLRKGNRALGVVQLTVQSLLSEEEVIRLPVVTLAF